MVDDNDAVDTALTVADAIPDDLGEGTEPVEVGEAEVTSESPNLYTVSVDGEEIQVTLEEALQGYQRQADYTRKTQEVASQREELAPLVRLGEALESDPQRTLQILAQSYGVDLGTAQRMVEQAIEEPDEPLDPEEARWQQVERFMQTQQEREAQAALDAKLGELQQRYGQFDEDEFIQFALESNIVDVEKAFGAWAFDRMVNKPKADRVAADQQVTERKQTAPPVAGGHGVVAGATSDRPAPITDVRGAFEAALREHDVTL